VDEEPVENLREQKDKELGEIKLREVIPVLLLVFPTIIPKFSIAYTHLY